MDPTRVAGLSVETYPGMPEPWPSTIGAFLVETYVRGGSRRTAAEYARILSRFFADANDPGLVDSMTVRRFAFRPVALGRPPAPSTVGVRLAAISGLYRIAEQGGLVARNPAAAVRRPRLGSPIPRGVEIADLRRLLALMPQDAAGARDRAIVVLILYTGLRRSEALGIRLDDLDLRAATVVTRLKGGTVRPRGLPPPVVEALYAWLDVREWSHIRESDDRLFGISDAAFYASLRARAATVGINGCTPHALRHTAAKLRRQAGASLEEVSALLGHASIATTARYLRRIEPADDDGWPAVARALGIGGESPPIRLSRSTSQPRAGPPSMSDRADALTPARSERQEGPE